MENIIRHWNGKTIGQRSDGYLNASQMCGICNKTWSRWFNLKTTTEYLKALAKSEDMLIVGESDNKGLYLIETHRGNSLYSGTWVHRRVALTLTGLKSR